MRKKARDPLKQALIQMEKLIRAEFKTLEKFSYGVESIPKPTLAKLMAKKKDCRVSTLKKICDGLGRELIIKVGKKI